MSLQYNDPEVAGPQGLEQELMRIGFREYRTADILPKMLYTNDNSAFTPSLGGRRLRPSKEKLLFSLKSCPNTPK